MESKRTGRGEQPETPGRTRVIEMPMNAINDGMCHIDQGVLAHAECGPVANEFSDYYCLCNPERDDIIMTRCVCGEVMVCITCGGRKRNCQELLASLD